MVKMVGRAVVLLALLGVPTQALAQLSIAGVVRDSSGAVLPGASVEASSAALIEKTREVVTNPSGLYQIVNLVPGTYTLTFTLSGFSTVRREGIVLSGNTFVATVNADLSVGSVAETVNVVSESPVVDIQNAIQQQTMTKELLSTIPAARQFFSTAQLVPGVSLTNMPSGLDVGGTAGVPQAAVLTHGSLTNDFRLNVDGLSVGTGGAGFTMWMPNPGQSEEISFTLAGGLGESETAGSVVNMVPKSGGNNFTGTIHVSATNSAVQGTNADDNLAALGFTNPNRIKRMYDFDPGVGGPLKRDHLWFYATYRDYNTQNWVANTFVNQNAGNVNAWTYVPDPTKPAFLSDRYLAGSLRLTFQPTPRNKFALHWDEQYRCESCAGAQAGGPGASGVAVTAGRSPEATQVGRSWPDRVQQASWSSPLNNRVLLYAGIGSQFEWETTQAREDGTASPLLVPVNEQAGAIPGLLYRAPDELRAHWGGSLSWKSSVSYVTGTHNAKFGYFGQWNYRTAHDERQQNLTYRFSNGVPNQITQYAAPIFISYTTDLAGLYAQDAVTLGRFTVQGGVRYDRLSTRWPAQSAGPAGFTSVQGQTIAMMPREFSFPAGDGVHFNDLTPRMSVTYDVAGNAKTALKFAAGKYMQLIAVGPGGGGAYEMSPLGRLNFSTTRSWNDLAFPVGDSRRGNFVPDCDLASPLQQPECGALANQNFGLPAPFSTTFDDPNIYSGWGNRPYQWELSAAVQQELLARVSLDVGYYRRVFGNSTVTDNLATGPGDFGQFKVTAPADAKLGENGGQTYTYLNVNENRFGQTNNRLRFADDFGGQPRTWNGVDVNINVRPRNGLTLQGGFSTGVTLTDNCTLIQELPELNGSTAIENCRNSTGMRTETKFLSSYEIPRIKVQVGGTFQSIPGATLAATFNAPNLLVAQSLGRPLSGNAANAPVNLSAPGTLFGDRINQLDFRVAKRLQFGGRRLQLGADLYNSLNINTIQRYIETYGTNYLNPSLIMPPRFLKFSAQLDF